MVGCTECGDFEAILPVRFRTEFSCFMGPNHHGGKTRSRENDIGFDRKEETSRALRRRFADEPRVRYAGGRVFTSCPTAHVVLPRVACQPHMCGLLARDVSLQHRMRPGGLHMCRHFMRRAQDCLGLDRREGIKGPSKRISMKCVVEFSTFLLQRGVAYMVYFASFFRDVVFVHMV